MGKKKKKKRYQEMINYPVTLVPFKLNALQTFHVFAFQLITADVIWRYQGRKNVTDN